jgi:hypothetical protein
MTSSAGLIARACDLSSPEFIVHVPAQRQPADTSSLSSSTVGSEGSGAATSFVDGDDASGSRTKAEMVWVPGYDAIEIGTPVWDVCCSMFLFGFFSRFSTLF